MISKAYLSLLQFLFLALATHAMPEPFLRETTDLPDDQKDLKDVETSDGDAHLFSQHPAYQNNVFTFRKASEVYPDFSYLDFPRKTASSWDDGSLTGLEDNGPVFSESGDMTKRGNHRSRQGGQKFRFDPALNRLGLGKRDGGDRPKYNPGWKFIGLGKRIMPILQGLNPSAFDGNRVESNDFKDGDSNAFLPYYRLLAMHDISRFLDNFKEGLQGNPRRSNQSQSSASDSLPLALYSPSGDTDASKVKHAISGILAVGQQNGNPAKSNNPELFFTRSRKPNGMWRNKSKPMYDPGYLMTGLGK